MAPRVTLKDLIGAGLLTPGEELECKPRRGEVYTAKLQPDGTIVSERQPFRTPSHWAEYVAGKKRDGRKMKRDGWRDISARGKPLESYRAMFSDGNKHIATQRVKLPPQPESIKTSPVPAVQPPLDSPKEALLTRLQNLTPNQFEHLVGAFLKAKGIAQVKVTGRSSDGGIDAVGVVPFVEVKVAVQAKRYASGNNVGIEPVQRLKGSMSSGYDRGVFITTSTFTTAAKGWVEETRAAITLVDGQQLAKELIELGLGVKPLIVSATIDEEFFEGLGG